MKRFPALGVAALVAFGAMACADGPTSLLSPDHLGISESLQVGDGDHEVVLVAGQNIDVGTVIVAVDEDDLTVTFATESPWNLTTARVWLGSSIADAPVNPGGNLVFGSFPYQSGAISASMHTFQIPLSDLLEIVGGTDVDDLCDEELYVIAHADVENTSTGAAEGAFGSGTRLSQKKGNRGEFFVIKLTCNGEPPVVQECETTFAFGDTPLNTLEGITSNRWGWQITLPAGFISSEHDLWAGAAQNDTSKGELVGELALVYENGWLTATYSMSEGFGLKETHLYAALSPTTTAAPGQFGNQNENLGGATSDEYNIDLGDLPAYVVAHAVVCEL